MKFQLPNKRTLVQFAVLCVVISACNVADEEKEREFLVDNFVIKFTDDIIQMDTPTDTAGVGSFTENADHLRIYFSSLDDKLMITRYLPDFNPSDTLRVNAAGDTVRQSNMALIFKFDLSKFVSFPDLVQKAEEEPLIDWVDPPYEISLD